LSLRNAASDRPSTGRKFPISHQSRRAGSACRIRTARSCGLLMPSFERTQSRLNQAARIAGVRCNPPIQRGRPWCRERSRSLRRESSAPAGTVAYNDGMAKSHGFVLKATSANGQETWAGPRLSRRRILGGRDKAEVFATRSEAHAAVGALPLAFDIAGFIFLVEPA